MSIGLLCSGVYYAYMGRRLSKKEGRADVTALPSGGSTPAMFVILYGVIMPLHYALEDPMLAWSAAVAACFIGGAVELDVYKRQVRSRRGKYNASWFGCIAAVSKAGDRKSVV